MSDGLNMRITSVQYNGEDYKIEVKNDVFTYVSRWKTKRQAQAEYCAFTVSLKSYESIKMITHMQHMISLLEDDVEGKDEIYQKFEVIKNIFIFAVDGWPTQDFYIHSEKNGVDDRTDFRPTNDYLVGLFNVLLSINNDSEYYSIKKAKTILKKVMEDHSKIDEIILKVVNFNFGEENSILISKAENWHEKILLDIPKIKKHYSFDMIGIQKPEVDQLTKDRASSLVKCIVPSISHSISRIEDPEKKNKFEQHLNSVVKNVEMRAKDSTQAEIEQDVMRSIEVLEEQIARYSDPQHEDSSADNRVRMLG